MPPLGIQSKNGRRTTAINSDLQNTVDHRRSAIRRMSTSTAIDWPATNTNTTSQPSEGCHALSPSRIDPGAKTAKSATPTTEDAAVKSSDQVNNVAAPGVRAEPYLLTATGNPSDVAYVTKSVALNSAAARPTSSAGASWATMSQKRKLPNDTTSVVASNHIEPPTRWT